jgi:lipid II:glycine glycyltransferase (peptidoglycan interpeptide bridge formation enzyme)
MVYEYGATAAEMKRFSPSALLLWHAIEGAANEGYDRFDFGRTELDNDSLASFKQRWGAERVLLRYYYWPRANGVAKLRTRRSARMIMRCTVKASPLPLLKIVAPVVGSEFV